MDSLALALPFCNGRLELGNIAGRLRMYGMMHISAFCLDDVDFELGGWLASRPTALHELLLYIRIVRSELP